jgi:hypothetical protein
MNRSEQIKTLAVALLKAQKQIKVAVKDSANPFFKSKYADFTTIVEAVKPALNENGIMFLQIVTPEGVETVLLHESGEYISGVTPVVVAKQNDPQALGSAITYAKRYGLQAIVGIPSEDDDGEAAMGRTQVKLPVAKPVPPKKVTQYTKEDYKRSDNEYSDLSDLDL